MYIISAWRCNYFTFSVFFLISCDLHVWDYSDNFAIYCPNLRGNCECDNRIHRRETPHSSLTNYLYFDHWINATDCNIKF